MNRAIALLLAALTLAACAGNDQAKIVIEWGGDPDRFPGLEVEIDGKVVGTLKAMDALTRNGFLVRKGDHTVRVVGPGLASEPLRVEATNSALPVLLLLEWGESAGGPAVLVLR